MLKLLGRLAALALLACAASPALAQGCGQANPNCIVTTMPLGDASRRAASDAFVQNQLAVFVPALTIGSTVVSGGAGLLYNTTPGGTLAAAPLSSNGVVTTNGSGVPTVVATLPAVNMPAPTAGTLGGVTSALAVAHQWIDSISTAGAPHLSQPNFTDISGSVAPTQLPTPTATTIGAVQSKTCSSSNWFNALSTAGVFGCAQPSFSDLTGQIVNAMVASNAAIDTAKLSYTAPYSGASAVTQTQYNNNAYWVTGVDPTGATDSTAAIQAAIDGAPTQATLLFPSGTFSVLGSGNCALTISATNKSLTLAGVGFNSWIKPAPTFPSGRDLVCFKPTAGTSGGGINNMRLGPAFLAPLGRHVVHVDLSDAGNAASMQDFGLSNLLIAPSATGRSIYVHSTVTNPTGGLFYSKIGPLNDIESILGQYIGDGITISGNVITNSGATTNPSIDISQIVGAGELKLSENVLANSGGCIILRSGVSPVITGGACEQTLTLTEANGAMIDITGDIASVSHPQIVNTQVQAIVGVTGVTSAIRLGATTNAAIYGNYVSVQGATSHVAATASTAGAFVGNGNQYLVNGSVSGLVITGSATGTTFSYQSNSPTGLSGGVSYFQASGNQASSATLNQNAIVFGGGPGGAPLTGNVSTDGQMLFGCTGCAPLFITPTGDVTSTVAGVLSLATTQANAHTWSATQTFTLAPVFTNQSGTRTALGLGTAAVQNTGTSGANVPLLNGTNTWANPQTITTAAAAIALAVNGSNAGGTSLAVTSASTSIGAFTFFSDGTNSAFSGISNGTLGCLPTGSWAVFATACRLTVEQLGSVVIGSAALATTATDGFLYITSSAGLPTGVPTAKTGRVPIQYDTTNHKICYYDPTTPSWRCSAAM